MVPGVLLWIICPFSTLGWVVSTCRPHLMLMPQIKVRITLTVPLGTELCFRKAKLERTRTNLRFKEPIVWATHMPVTRTPLCKPSDSSLLFYWFLQSPFILICVASSIGREILMGNWSVRTLVSLSYYTSEVVRSRNAFSLVLENAWSKS